MKLNRRDLLKKVPLLATIPFIKPSLSLSKKSSDTITVNGDDIKFSALHLNVDGSEPAYELRLELQYLLGNGYLLHKSFNINIGSEFPSQWILRKYEYYLFGKAIYQFQDLESWALSHRIKI